MIRPSTRRHLLAAAAVSALALGGPALAQSPGNLKLVKVDADENPIVSRRFGVQSIPTLVLLEHGEVVDTQIGALPEHLLRSWVESRLPNRER